MQIKNNAKRRCEARQYWDAAAPRFPSLQFDVIVCRHLLWTLPEPTRVLERWVDLLRRNGRLLLIEGYWKTGAGLHADQIVEILPSSLINITVQNLSDQPDLWGGAASTDPSLYRWSPVPQGEVEAARYVETALSWKNSGSAVPFAIVRVDDGVVIGSTLFWNLERWSWPEGHPAHGRNAPDVCEIGYTWLTRLAIRTAANTEAKLLMLTHAFEAWQVHL